MMNKVLKKFDAIYNNHVTQFPVWKIPPFIRKKITYISLPNFTQIGDYLVRENKPNWEGSAVIMCYSKCVHECISDQYSLLISIYVCTLVWIIQWITTTADDKWLTLL